RIAEVHSKEGVDFAEGDDKCLVAQEAGGALGFARRQRSNAAHEIERPAGGGKDIEIGDGVGAPVGGGNDAEILALLVHRKLMDDLPGNHAVGIQVHLEAVERELQNLRAAAAVVVQARNGNVEVLQ